MPDSYITRSLEPVLIKATSEFPAVILTGPRKSGKTKLLQKLFGQHYRYVSLEAPDIRLVAVEDPRGFLERYPPPVIMDEVQHVPDLFPYIKEKIDSDRPRTGQYLLASSQNLLVTERVTESLAGRAATPPTCLGAVPSTFDRIITAYVWWIMGELSSRGIPRACSTSWAGCITMAQQVHPDSSRAGCSYAASSSQPDALS